MNCANDARLRCASARQAKGANGPRAFRELACVHAGTKIVFRKNFIIIKNLTEMKDRRLQIKEALESMVHTQRHKEFQWLAVQLLKKRWPELEATQEWSDGGEDATSFFAGSDGLKRSLACSLTGTLGKIKSDAARLKARNVKLDVLVFVTPIPVTNLDVSDWCKDVENEFKHKLHVIPQAELVTLLEQPENSWLCRRYLRLDLGDEPTLPELEDAMRRAATGLL
ncbi:MAG TPA: hypothetical protein VMO20_04305, partial [Candidatus Acidoferrum sp.]|nr:hypothetical protein [Candidatus Acidoferrum sp.]